MDAIVNKCCGENGLARDRKLKILPFFFFKQKTEDERGKGREGRRGRGRAKIKEEGHHAQGRKGEKEREGG